MNSFAEELGPNEKQNLPPPFISQSKSVKNYTFHLDSEELAFISHLRSVSYYLIDQSWTELMI